MRYKWAPRGVHMRGSYWFLGDDAFLSGLWYYAPTVEHVVRWLRKEVT